MRQRKVSRTASGTSNTGRSYAAVIQCGQHIFAPASAAQSRCVVLGGSPLGFVEWSRVLPASTGARSGILPWQGTSEMPLVHELSLAVLRPRGLSEVSVIAAIFC